MQHSKGLLGHIFAISLIITPHMAWSGTPLSLDDAVQHALAHNPNLAAQGAYARAMREVAPQVGSLPDPVLSLGALNLPTNNLSPTQENMTQFQIGIRQAIPFYGTRGLRASIADLTADAADFDTDELRLLLVRRVKTSWWNIVYLDHALEMVTRNQQLLRQLIQVTEAKYKVGQGLQQDVLLAQLELSKLLDMKLQLTASRQQSVARLNALLNQPDNVVVTLPEKVPELLPELPDADTLFAEAFTSRPLLARQHRMVQVAQQRIELAEQDFSPDFNLGAAYGLRRGHNATGSPRSDLASIQLSMNLPFFTPDKQNHQLAQRKAEWARAGFDYQDTKDAVMTDISVAMAGYKQAREQSILFKRGIIPQAQQTLASMRAAYQVNQVDFLNLVRTQITLYNYETQYWKSLAEAHQQLASLERSMGKAIEANITESTHE